MGGIQLTHSSIRENIHKIIQKLQNLFKSEQTYESWLQSTSAYAQTSILSDGIEGIHNTLNEIKENQNIFANEYIKSHRISPLRVTGTYAEYVV